MKEKETLIKKTYELLKITIPIVNKFPRNYKFSLGDRIQNQLTDLLEQFIYAYYLPADEKHKILRNNNIRLEIIRYYFRLCYDLGLYSSLKYRFFAEKIEEIGRMTGGWLKSLKAKK